MTTADDPLFEALVRETPAREAEALGRRDRATEAGFALGLRAAVAALVVWVPAPATSTIVLALALAAVQTIARCVRFTVGAVTAAPTLLATVPMLLLLHPAVTVLIIVAASLLSRAPSLIRREAHPDHVLLCVGDAWFAVGPAIVLALAAPPTPTLHAWPVYVAALATLFAVDHVATLLRLWLALGVPPRLSLRLGAIIFAIDCAVAPIGLAVALIARDHAAAPLLVVPLLALLAALGRE